MTTRNFGGAVTLARRTALAATAAFVVAAALPALAAAASTAWVSPAPKNGPFNSCAAPGYNSIQEAATISPAKTTIHVCAGTYKEQVVIAKQDTVVGEAGATLKLPAAPANTTTACDAPGEQDLLMICTGGKVKVSGLTFDGSWPEGTCNEELYAINAGGGANLTLTGSTILHAGANPINGCQGGIGVEVGRNFTKQVATAKLSEVKIEGYQKGGMEVDGPGSKATIASVTIKGAGPVNIAQNGIQVSRGAVSKISAATIEGNECNAGSCGPNSTGFTPWQEEEDATGILFYKAAGGSSVKNSTINNNDIGVYNLLNGGSAKTKVSGNNLKGNRFWGVALDQGSAKVDNNTISGPGKAGIQIVQYGTEHQFTGFAEGQEFAASGTGKSDAISGMECALEGLSDNNAKDKPASLTITKSLAKFSANTQPLCNNNEGKIKMSLS